MQVSEKESGVFGVELLLPGTVDLNKEVYTAEISESISQEEEAEEEEEEGLKSSQEAAPSASKEVREIVNSLYGKGGRGGGGRSPYRKCPHRPGLAYQEM